MKPALGERVMLTDNFLNYDIQPALGDLLPLTVHASGCSVP